MTDKNQEALSKKIDKEFIESVELYGFCADSFDYFVV